MNEAHLEIVMASNDGHGDLFVETATRFGTPVQNFGTPEQNVEKNFRVLGFWTHCLTVSDSFCPPALQQDPLAQLVAFTPAWPPTRRAARTPESVAACLRDQSSADRLHRCA